MNFELTANLLSPSASGLDLSHSPIQQSKYLTDNTNSIVNNLNNSNGFSSTNTITPPSSNNNLLDDEHNKQNSAISIGKRFIANLIPGTSFQPLKIPFPEEEHYLLSSESNYYVNDKNLSSIVAFTLSSKEYKEFLVKVSLPESLNQHSTTAIKDNNNSNTFLHTNQQQFTEIDDMDTNSVLLGQQENKLHFEHRRFFLLLN